MEVTMFDYHPAFLFMEGMTKLGNMFGLLLAKLGFLRKDNVGLAKFITSLPPSVAQYITLGQHDNPIADWYHKNGIFKFPIGTPIALVSIRNFGYGVRPVGVVVGYTESGGYQIQMEQDKDGDFFSWMNGCYLPSGKRLSEKENHFKWNIEYHFKAISKPEVNLAYN